MLFDTTYVFLLLAFMYDNLFFLHTCLQSYSIVVTHTSIKKLETGAHLGKVCISTSMYVICILYVDVFPHRILSIFGMLQHVESHDVSLKQKQQ